MEVQAYECKYTTNIYKDRKSAINGAEINSVNARELHSQLEVKKLLQLGLLLL